jgi:polar amino acid transport system substrate-binding protein
MRRKRWRCSRARGCLLWPERDWRLESGAERENQTGGQRRRRLAEGGAHRGDAEKGSGLVEPVQTALNGVIKNGDYDKVLNRWGKG